MSSLLPAPASARVQVERIKLTRTLRRGWNYFRSRLSAPAPSESLQDGPSDRTSVSASTRKNGKSEGGATEMDDDGPVDAVVVDNDGFQLYNTFPTQEPPSTEPFPPGIYEKSETGASSEHDHSELSSPSHIAEKQNRLRRTLHRFISFAIPVCSRFTSLCEDHRSREETYWKEKWFATKRLSLFGGLWLVINWVLAVSFARRPFNYFDAIFFYLISPILVIPVPFMIMADMPHGGKNVLYQIWVTCAVWSNAIFNILDVYLCGFFGTYRHLSCVDVDFFNIVYYSCAIPAIALFSLHQNRVPALFAVTLFLSLVLGLIVPIRANFLRHVLETGVFHAFLLYMNLTREESERRVFNLKEQIKLQYRATQKAQVAERKSSDSKRRLTNYIFHEVRVPLNTATLAFQNLEASGVINQDNTLEFTALGGSLGMMSKVLSDILDFNRMDAGKLASVEKPYNFHKVLRSMLPGARVVADARGMQLVADFDPKIDAVTRRALYVEQDLPEDEIRRRMNEDLDDAIVVGDEMRLRQVITNLLSNALKFNIPGPSSRVTLRTRLLRPSASEMGPEMDDGRLGRRDSLRTNRSRSTSVVSPKPRKPDAIVVRIEVQDTGVAIKAKDMAEYRLFSPYVQTEIGRSQGGKGTGLGLALVKHIVALSGGRLGVISERGVGSTFWVELALGVGARALYAPNRSDAPAQLSEGDWHKFAYPSPSTTMNNTPVINPAETVQTPSTLGGISNASGQPPTDYIGNYSEARSSSPAMVESHPLTESSAGYASVDLTRIPASSAEEHPRTLSSTSMLSSIPEAPPHPIRTPRPTFIPMPSRYPTPTISNSGPSTSTSRPAFSPRSSSSGTRVGEDMKILVVDDDSLTRRLMSRMLQRLGCEVDTAEDGQVALGLLLTGDKFPPHTPSSPLAGAEIEISAETDVMLNEHRFNLVFLDNQMPNLSGVEMTKRLRSFGRKDFVVGVTGNALAEDQREYMDAGADHVLTKPVREENLKEMLTLARARRRPGPTEFGALKLS